MRILHLLSSTSLSGAENVAADICMMYGGTDEVVYCSPDGPIRDSLASRGVEFLPLKTLNLREVSRALKGFGADLIHSHDVRATAMSAVLPYKAARISHLHVNEPSMREVSLKSVVYLIALFRMSHVLAVSSSCLGGYRFAGSLMKKAIVLPNIVLQERVRLLAGGPVGPSNEFAYLGRLVPAKDPLRVARIAAGVLRQVQEARFCIMGQGPLADGMRDVFDSSGVSERVSFLGSVSAPYARLSSARCLLMASRYEGTPIAALEAMSLGVPIVTTPTDGMVDLVEDGISGFISPEDQILTDRIASLIEDRWLHSRISGAVTRRFVEVNDEASYRHVLDRIYDEYRGLPA